MLKKKSYNVSDQTLIISTGQLANLSAGSVTLQLGNTTLLATTTVSKNESEQDFFPLSVDYVERMYARGAISGSRYYKREGFPSDEAIIKARQVDHSIRSLFPKGFRRAVSVILTVLSYDEKNDPEILTVLGASLSLMLSGVPYAGPSSSCVVCIRPDGEVVVNPFVDDRENMLAEIIVSGLDDKFLNVEGWAKEISNEQMEKILLKSMEQIKIFNEIQRDFYKYVKESEYFVQIDDDLELPTSPELIDYVKTNYFEEIRSALFVDEKEDRSDMLLEIKKKIHEQWNAEHETVDDKKLFEIHLAVEYVARKILREAVLIEEKRVSGRGLEEIRPISAEVDIIPHVHGSALFNRGLTQSLSIVTLGALSMSQEIDEMEGETKKRFMHHYNFPPFATGESSKYSFKPGRREIGHGAIGENALKHMIPSEQDFPYTIRVVSEILTSNGSTSMAATCASSMALMAAGVPLKSAVAGIGVGLITEDGNDENYKLLLDIEGIEDFYGDMDFKVTGTINGITAIQFENKLRGVKFGVLSNALRLAEKGRLQILDVMNHVIARSRDKLSANAPVVESLKIQKEQIGELIGPGGKNIREIIQDASDRFGKTVDININDDGTIHVTAINKAQSEFVKSKIESMFAKPEVGKVYDGIVDKVVPFGVFVNVSNNISGLLHISEMSPVNKNPDINKIFKPGDKIKVKISKVEGGRTCFTLIGVLNPPDFINKLDTMVSNNATRSQYQINGYKIRPRSKIN
ncbi:polyribonucleotide nucleotidyltransferase [Candidatus Dojkabacteria bacterium]|uniref:Polyribonucleotide nucleotidyltransferase n=1 Tax=Candidatus Dojkabacteria bacterium TaxID=2099670 RepID=A0A3M0Z1E3_9BACT|nr:MAG: polyribonucleotide nucleotidyltransferase [Candidatus Dojkabacteria bacterium]